MEGPRVEIRAHSAAWRAGVEFRVMSSLHNRLLALTEGPQLPEGAVVPSTCLMRNSDVQTLMDDLWQAGFRPTEGTGSAGALAAVEKHLADMQKFAYKAYEIT